ncbi:MULTISPECIES: phosphoribosyltransferase [Methylomicrobium]|uniref:Putative phosphoribosyltransferase n=1 Tax=Methylomicrobium album BG8 TaxID=686340 RepID=H8GJV9_METAL|nr:MULTISPECIES: phosphoribosyltransferase [Methylomicrobium]EIC27918.1 putative phosphoribosyltransferase [Methylomicrobium album BG8]
MMPETMPCTLVTWEEVYRLCREAARKIRTAGAPVDMIVAIARGGYIPGRLLSDMLGVSDLTALKIEHYRGAQKQREVLVKYPLNADINGRDVLLVDDVCDSGETFAVAVEHLRRSGTSRSLHTAAMQLKTVSEFVPDHYAGTIGEWRWIIYPWAVNEDLSSLIEKMRLDTRDPVRLRQAFRRLHDVDVTLRQVEDALGLLDD